MRLAIVIPAYDDPHCLRLCLEGLAQQTEAARDPVIVVADSDPAGRARAVVEEFTGRMSIVCRTLPGPRRARRAAAARNRGWRDAAAAGAVRVLFIDHDCVAAAGVLAAHAAYGDRPVVVVGTRRHIPQDVVAALMPGDVATLDRRAAAPDERLESPWFRALSESCEELPIAGGVGLCAFGCHVSYPVGILEATGGFWEAFVGWGHQDVELAVRAGRAGAHLVVRGDLVVDHLDHPAAPETPGNRARLLATLDSDIIVHEAVS